ncbi:MAG: outer membrane lipoprotein-sorting protein [Bacteroidetes bacterium]|uniref:Outer membrane lipoprotein-sorting protein n=1 Tax=Phaeocystidibacter marisrubri TaxID=1577780 RepID=A0A6L3ZCY2_9FLAO|nr:outer membrane lipoprotein-sorting protein [Phaeocystidibacter marisrubri]KAB2815085.1 outer membrane lipoprotein-sorting protein [Phaeocystidibacter marisrubri]TNE27666.1 MAG: outer membrane lipoprotein-sorting protein [Bacteroidota bacterium]GGH70218.1 outer membrane lipoprotein-sorting protein [Phaeocystidibacter marisrubri]
MKRLLTLLVLVISVFSYGQSADEIVKKSEDKLRGSTSKGVMEIKIVRPTWERTITATSWSAGSDSSLVLINAPARDKGTVFLKRDKEIWNYIPTINRQVKMPPSMMAQSWMGSDFNNDDLVRESSLVVDYTHTLLRRETIRGKECYVIESKPKPEAPVVWGKLVSWITVDENLQWQTEFYDQRDELVQRMEGFDVVEFDGRTLPSRMRMTPLDEEDGYYTELKYIELDFDVTFPENFFSVQNMRRVR